MCHEMAYVRALFHAGVPCGHGTSRQAPGSGRCLFVWKREPGAELSADEGKICVHLLRYTARILRLSQFL